MKWTQQMVSDEHFQMPSELNLYQISQINLFQIKLKATQTNAFEGGTPTSLTLFLTWNGLII